MQQKQNLGIKDADVSNNFPGKMKMASKLYTFQRHHVMWKLGEKTAPLAEVPHGSRDIDLDVGVCVLIHV